MNEINYFEYLDELRESGVTNMFGAAPYLQKTFGVSQKEATKILIEWMASYEK
jgi:hypothetical protein